MKIKLSCSLAIAVMFLASFLLAQPVMAEKNLETEIYNAIGAGQFGEPCDGFYRSGISYQFTIGGQESDLCNAGTMKGPGIIDNIAAPNVAGSSEGMLHLTFDTPVNQLGFGVATGTESLEQQLVLASQSVLVSLLRTNGSMLHEELDLQLDSNGNGDWFNGRYEYAGAPIIAVTISWSSTAADIGGYIDNVVYFSAPGQVKKVK